MRTERVMSNGTEVAVVYSEEVVITDVNSALDFMATVQYDTGCKRIVLNKAAVTEDFFVLSTKIAGEILQKFVNYDVQFAIYGDYSGYTSKPLKDFIYESNHGKDFFFVADQEQAINHLMK